MGYDTVGNNQNEMLIQPSKVESPNPTVSTLPCEVGHKGIIVFSKGWFKIHRKLWESGDFKDEVFSEREAWMWIIANANFKENKVVYNEELVKLDRGQLVTSIRRLAGVFKWGRQRIDTFLKRLQKSKTLSIHKVRHRYTLITVCNYDSYQDEENENMTPPSHRADHRHDTAMTRGIPGQKNDKECKERKERKEPLMSNPSDVDDTRVETKSQLINKEVQEIYDFYIEQSGRNPNQYRLTDKRKRHIRARLKEFTKTQISFAIQGMLKNDFMQGDNENGTKYLDLDIVVRSTEQCEKWSNKFLAERDKEK